jgi:hypothetical protein
MYGIALADPHGTIVTSFRLSVWLGAVSRLRRCEEIPASSTWSARPSTNKFVPPMNAVSATNGPSEERNGS